MPETTPPQLDYAIEPFVCLGCGNCCRGDGFVRVGSIEMARLAEFLNLTTDEFQATYTRVPEDLAQAAVGDRWLTERPGPERDCVFLENNRCLVNLVKPDQCVGFPTQWRTPDIMDYCDGMRRA